MTEFDEATVYNEQTRDQLNEMQQFYADYLIERDNEVRFNVRADF